MVQTKMLNEIDNLRTGNWTKLEADGEIDIQRPPESISAALWFLDWLTPKLVFCNL